VDVTEPAEARYLRNKLVDAIEARGDLQPESRVAEAMRAVPRHLFVPRAPLEQAYGDHPVPIGQGQTISQPTVVAMMTEALAIQGGERILEIGTGCGYQTAILARLAREVYTVELITDLALMARERFETLGFTNVHSRIGDGYRGWLEYAPYDRILVTAAPPSLPDGLLAQLADGGTLVAPVGATDRDQVLRIVRREADLYTFEDLGAVRFVPMVRREKEWVN
jgi:protein-L-isoaspartate(D-aspartate) O-methyltransferase